MLKRKFTIHLDAILVITVLFVCSIGLNVFLLQQASSLGDENFGQQMKLIENDMNLNSQKHYIDKLKKQISEQEEKSNEGN